MSTLSEGYASYMTHFHKFEPRLDTFRTAFTTVYDLINQGLFIDCKLDSEISQYPKYPCIYQFFDKTKAFNLWKIYNVTLDTVEILTDYITNKNALTLKSHLDSIPNDIINIRNDIYLQYTFMSDLNDLFDTKLHFHDFSNMNKILNFYNSLSESPYDDFFTEDTTSFIHIFTFEFAFRHILKNVTNLPMILSTYCLEEDLFSKNTIKQGFANFAESNHVDLFKTCSKIILQSLYKMSNIDNRIIDLVFNNIESNSEKLKTAFNNFVDNSISSPVLEFANYNLNSLYLTYSSNIISQIANNNQIFNLGYYSNKAREENAIFKNFIESVSSSNVRNYLYVTYLYKFYPIKFLNVKPLVVAKYVEELVKPDSSLAYSQTNLESILSQCLSSSNIYYNNLTTALSDITTPQYLIDLAQNEKIVEFSSFLYFINLFDEFMESDYYSDFVDGVYEDCFDVLKRTGHIDHSFNWNNCQILFDLFFKTFIRRHIVDNLIFTEATTEFKNAFISVLEGSTGDPKYDLTITFGANRVKSLLNNIINSHFGKIHSFIESMYLSKLSNMITSQFLSYFMDK
jgi:hypothetical protein